MRLATLVFIALIAAVLWRGTPLPVSHPQEARYWDAAQELLPMSFSHDDHRRENCVACHHNYADDTGGDSCMRCHVNDKWVSAVLEAQFHQLCMGCHVERELAGKNHGPTRHCSGCHLQDDRP